MNKLNIKQTGNVVGVISIVFFVICTLWGFLITDPVLNELHLNILRITYPGFAMSFVGLIIGLIETFIYGWFFGALFAWLHGKICK